MKRIVNFGMMSSLALLLHLGPAVPAAYSAAALAFGDDAAFGFCIAYNPSVAAEKAKNICSQLGGKNIKVQSTSSQRPFWVALSLGRFPGGEVLIMATPTEVSEARAQERAIEEWKKQGTNDVHIVSIFYDPGYYGGPVIVEYGQTSPNKVPPIGIIYNDYTK